MVSTVCPSSPRSLQSFFSGLLGQRTRDSLDGARGLHFPVHGLTRKPVHRRPPLGPQRQARVRKHLTRRVVPKKVYTIHWQNVLYRHLSRYGYYRTNKLNMNMITAAIPRQSTCFLMLTGLPVTLRYPDCCAPTSRDTVTGYVTPHYAPVHMKPSHQSKAIYQAYPEVVSQGKSYHKPYLVQRTLSYCLGHCPYHTPSLSSSLDQGQ